MADAARYTAALNLTSAQVVLGMMPGCSDHNRCTSAAVVANHTAQCAARKYRGVMTWAAERDVPTITGYSGSISELIVATLKPAALGVVAALPAVCPTWKYAAERSSWAGAPRANVGKSNPVSLPAAATALGGHNTNRVQDASMCGEGYKHT
jgi:hypothetical protein